MKKREDYEGLEEIVSEDILRYIISNKKRSLEIREKLRKERKVIPGTKDVIFKNVMRKCPNYLCLILEYFLNCEKEILEQVINFDSSELLVNNAMEARKTTDIIVRVGNKIINLEMNSVNYKLLVERNVAYISKLKAESFETGEVYEKIYTVIQINFDLDWKYDDREIIKFLLTDKDKGLILTENYQIYNINLSKIKQKYYNKEKLNKFERAIALLTLEKIKDLEEISKGDKDLMEAKEEIKKLSNNLGTIGVYDYWEFKNWELKMREKDMEERVIEEVTEKVTEEVTERVTEEVTERVTEEVTEKVTEEVTEKVTEEVTEKVTEEVKMEMAKKFLKKGLSLEDILEVTGLKKEEIEKLL